MAVRARLLRRAAFLLPSAFILFLAAASLPAANTAPGSTSSSRVVQFHWNASTSSSVVGYKIFWGTGTRNYQNVRDVRNVLSTSLSLSTGTQYYVTVAAYSLTSTSRLSNEVIVPVASVSW